MHMLIETQSGWIARMMAWKIIDEKNHLELYTAAMYFIIQTFTQIGYKDIVGTTAQELLFQSIVIMSGIVLYGFLLGTVSSMVQTLSKD
jgi:hypothetical protein